MGRLWYQFPVSYVVTPQFVRDYLPRFASMFLQQPPKEALRSLYTLFSYKYTSKRDSLDWSDGEAAWAASI